MRVVTLRKRADFLKVQNSRHRFSRPAFLLACLPVDTLGLSARGLVASGDAGGMGALVGYTVTKKIGNAVVRNRTKRRLRALAVPLIAESGRPGHAYVWIVRPAILAMPHALLQSEMRWALRKVRENMRPRPEIPADPPASAAVPETAVKA